MLAHLRRTLNDFIFNETGFVRQRTGLPVAWAAGVLVAAAIFFGMPDNAHAACPTGWGPICSPGGNDCHYCLEEGCSSSQCAQYSPGVTKCYCYQ